MVRLTYAVESPGDGWPDFVAFVKAAIPKADVLYWTNSYSASQGVFVGAIAVQDPFVVEFFNGDNDSVGRITFVQLGQEFSRALLVPVAPVVS